MQYGVVIFRSTSHAIRAERVLDMSDLATKLIPTPRQFSSDCGLALRFEWDRREDVEEVLKRNEVEFTGIASLGLQDRN